MKAVGSLSQHEIATIKPSIGSGHIIPIKFQFQNVKSGGSGMDLGLILRSNGLLGGYNAHAQLHLRKY